MKLFQPSKDNLDEVVFENRNKLYGAYAIRKDYDANLTKATISSFSLFIFLVGGMYIAAYFKPETPFIPPTAGSGPSLPDRPTEIETNIEIIADNAMAAIVPIENQVLQIVRDHLMPTIQPPVQNPNLSTGSGQPGTGPSGPETGGAGTGTGPGDDPGDGPSEELEIDVPQKLYTFVSKMPEFPGGTEKLAEYLQKNIRYPGNAIESGLEGKVVVIFVVNSDGQITDITLRKTMGFGLDDEAVRVVSAMPKWSPGIQNGKAVRVQMVLPVVFKLH